MGGILEFCASTLYHMWGGLTEALRTGEPRLDVLKRNGIEGHDMWDTYFIGEKAKEFMQAMAEPHTPAHREFAKRFDFDGCETLLDIGGAGAHCCCEVARQNVHMTCINLDLPSMEKLAMENVHRQGLDGRVVVQNADFWKDELDRADVIVMIDVLHDYGSEQKDFLMKKAFDALMSGGGLVVIEMLIDDERENSVPGLLMSLNMLVATVSGFKFSRQDCDSMAKKAGFSRTEVLQLVPPIDAVIAYKN